MSGKFETAKRKFSENPSTINKGLYAINVGKKISRVRVNVTAKNF
jgi:hypothetical protein